MAGRWVPWWRENDRHMFLFFIVAIICFPSSGTPFLFLHLVHHSRSRDNRWTIRWRKKKGLHDRPAGRGTYSFHLEERMPCASARIQMLFLNEKKCPSWRKDSYHRHSHQFFFFHFQWKMKKKMTVNRWLSFSLAITKKKRKSYVTELESSFGHTFSLFCYWSPRTSLWSRPTCKEKRNSWPGFSWHNDSECYRQEKIKEKVGQAVSVSRAYCGPHQEREKNGPQ